VATGTATRRRVALTARKQLRSGHYTLRLRAHGHTTVRRITIV
jgi:hypothetical protein